MFIVIVTYSMAPLADCLKCKKAQQGFLEIAFMMYSFYAGHAILQFILQLYKFIRISL